MPSFHLFSSGSHSNSSTNDADQLHRRAHSISAGGSNASRTRALFPLHTGNSTSTNSGRTTPSSPTVVDHQHIHHHKQDRRSLGHGHAGGGRPLAGTASTPVTPTISTTPAFALDSPSPQRPTHTPSDGVQLTISLSKEQWRAIGEASTSSGTTSGSSLPSGSSIRLVLDPSSLPSTSTAHSNATNSKLKLDEGGGGGGSGGGRSNSNSSVSRGKRSFDKRLSLSHVVSGATRRTGSGSGGSARSSLEREREKQLQQSQLISTLPNGVPANMPRDEEMEWLRAALSEARIKLSEVEDTLDSTRSQLKEVLETVKLKEVRDLKQARAKARKKEFAGKLANEEIDFISTVDDLNGAIVHACTSFSRCIRNTHLPDIRESQVEREGACLSDVIGPLVATSIAEQIYKRNEGEDTDPQFATFCALALVFSHVERYFGPWSNYGNEAGHSSTADEPLIGPLADLFRQLLILGGWELMHSRDHVFRQSLSILVDAIKNLQNHFELEDISTRWRLVFVKHGMDLDPSTMCNMLSGAGDGNSDGGRSSGSGPNDRGAPLPKVAAQIRLGVRALDAPRDALRDGRRRGFGVPMATIVTEEEWMSAYN